MRTTSFMILPCLQCGESYAKPKGGMSHFCEPCRRDRHLEGKRARAAEIRASKADLFESLDEYVRRITTDETRPEVARAMIGEYLDDEVDGDPAPIVPDRMPDGSNSPAGSDDGTSTYFTDLADELDARHRDVAKHPWFAANPHWSFDLHNEGADLDKLRAT